jgi:DNA polymerase III subunit delta'
MHHAWILTGPKGVGKASFAYAAAAELVAEPGVPQPEIEVHPDILIPRHPPATKEDEKKRDEGLPHNVKRSIPVDEIRALQRRLTTRPTLGSRRAIILDPADDLETSAVNALLKSLEEPPAGTYFLLVTHRLGRLLPTIRSRCRILRFSSLSDGAVDGILKAQAPQADGPTRAAAVTAAQGSPGVALDFVHEELAAAHQLMGRILAEGDAGMMLRGLLAEELGARPKRERLSAVLDLARAVLAADLRSATPRRQARLIEAHGAMVKLAREAPIYNYDPGLLAMEIGALLASSAVPTEAGNR